MTYTVEVTREGGTWVADVTNMAGAHTYAKNLVALNIAVQEVIELVEDLPEDHGPVEVRYTYTNVDEKFIEAARLGDQRRAIEVESAHIQSMTADAISTLVDNGWSVRDISGVLQISPGRVSQLASK